jgi:hypothetical protein
MYKESCIMHITNYMRSSFLFLLVTLIISPSISSAQKFKVKRKGVKLIDVTKTSTGRSLYSLQQFAGKWQEISRASRENYSGEDFTDTLFLHFYNDSDVSVRNGRDLSVRGNADIDPENILTVGGDQFIIKSLDNTKAKLDDGEMYIHTMIKVKNFLYETFPTDSIIVPNFTTPVAASLSDVIGKWNVYRRTAKPGATAYDEMLITRITIENKSSDEFNGEIAFSQSGTTEVLPCSVTIEDSKINIATTKHTWQMDMYEANAEEFIFGNAGLVYYCKRK